MSPRRTRIRRSRSELHGTRGGPPKQSNSSCGPLMPTGDGETVASTSCLTGNVREKLYPSSTNAARLGTSAQRPSQMTPSATDQFEAVSADDRYARRSSRVSAWPRPREQFWSRRAAKPARRSLEQAKRDLCTPVQGACRGGRIRRASLGWDDAGERTDDAPHRSVRIHSRHDRG